MERAAMSPVIASIILSAMVLVVGAGVWSYSQGAASMVANDYADDTIDMINTIQERYVIEHISFDNDTHTFTLWMYNYGDVPIEIDTRITINDTNYDNNNVIISSDDIQTVIFDVGSTLSINEDITIYILTDRGNSYRGVYYVK